MSARRTLLLCCCALALLGAMRAQDSEAGNRAHPPGPARELPRPGRWRGTAGQPVGSTHALASVSTSAHPPGSEPAKPLSRATVSDRRHGGARTDASPAVRSLGAAGEATTLVRLHLSPADRVAAARVVANEDSRPLRPASDGGTEGALTLDSYAILQAVRDVARAQGWSHHRALRALAPHVTGLRTATQRRHALYGSLPARGFARPAGWSDAIDGPWTAYARNWARLREGVGKAIANGFPAPCTTLAAWGGAMDDGIALGRGLVRARCAGQGEMRNRFWSRPMYAARVAAGVAAP